MPNAKLFIVRKESGGIGGAEKVTRRFAKAFSEYFETTILDSDELERSGGFSNHKSGPSWLRVRRFAYYANRFLANHPPALVLSMERGVAGDVYRFGDGVHKVWLQKRYGSPLGWIGNPLHWLLPILEKISVIRSKALVANSAMVASEIKTHYQVDDVRLNVIRNGFDGKTFGFAEDEVRRKIKSELKAPEDNRINILFSGSGWKRKGLQESITMLDRLRSSGTKASLWVAGKGDPEAYRKKIDSLGLSNEVVFLGQIPDVSRWYQIADLMILPTSYDPFSNSCLEALACGCLVLTTSSNGAAEVITSESGFIATDPSGCAKRDAIDWAIQARNLDRRKISFSVADSLQEREIAQYLKILMRESPTKGE
jgi:UDP-glucose:(heptosyl)LPS alpha-1,3-glucosyltransferase